MFDALRRALADESAVRIAYLFGSQARGAARPASDVDVAVLGVGPFDLRALGALAERLARACGGEIDIVDLASASPVLAMEVVRDGRLLLARNPDEELDFRLRTVREYQDTAHLRRVQNEALSRWAAERARAN